jgi:peptide/nickel transport system substrate-binding protein
MINALYQGVYQPAWGPIAQSTPSYDKTVENSWHQDLAQANQDLDQLGYAKRDSAGFRVNSAGKELVAVLPGADGREQRPQLSLLIKQAEAKVGINVQINSDPTTSLDQIENGGFALTASAHVDASPDILRLLFGSQDTPPQGGLNYGRINDPQLDQWLVQATSSLDPATQDHLYGQVQTYAVDHALVIPLYQEQTLNALTSKLHGITFDATGYVLYYDAWLSH